MPCSEELQSEWYSAGEKKNIPMQYPPMVLLRNMNHSKMEIDRESGFS